MKMGDLAYVCHCHVGLETVLDPGVIVVVAVVAVVVAGVVVAACVGTE